VGGGETRAASHREWKESSDDNEFFLFNFVNILGLLAAFALTYFVLTIHNNRRNICH